MKKRIAIPWSEKEKDHLIKRVVKEMVHPRDIITELNEKFGIKRSFSSVKTKLRDLGVSYAGLLTNVQKEKPPEIEGLTEEDMRKSLSKLGYKVEKIEEEKIDKKFRVDTSMFESDTIKFGVISCTHLGCLPAKSNITTKEGIKHISKIEIGEKVLTHKNRFRKVLNVQKRRMHPDEQTLLLKFRHSTHNQLTLTSNHPLLIRKGNENIWVKARDVKKGDFVISVPSECKWCGEKVPYWRKTCNNCDPYTRSKARGHRERWMLRYNQMRRRKKFTHYYRDILPETEKLKKEGWRVIPIGIAMPDIVGIKNNKVVAFEIESGYRNAYLSKYKWTLPETKDLFDEIKWIFRKERKKETNWKYNYTNKDEHGLIGIEIADIVQRPKLRWVYNLETEEDNSYVANNIIVHNSKYQQLTFLKNFYQYASDKGCGFILHCGDMVDGIDVYRGHEFELFLHGAKAQKDYALEYYPKLENGGKTYVIDGNHDHSFLKKAGINVLEDIAKEREDIMYCGTYGAYPKIPNLKTYMQHGDGGVSYARSYKLQKIIEQFSPDAKPDIWFVGHWHVSCALFEYRNVIAFMIPTFQSQTPYLRRKGLYPEIGGLMIEFKINDYFRKRGIAGMNFNWIPFYIPRERDY